jgi:threonine synthase
MLQILRASGGAAVAVTDEALTEGARRLADDEGIPAGTEAGAAVAALPLLLESGVVTPGDRVVCFVTGRG